MLVKISSILRSIKKNETGPVYNMIYQDGKGGNVMVKRFTVGGTTRDKEYVLTKGKEGSKMLWFSLSNEKDAETVRAILRPKPKLRITQIDVNFNEVEVKGRGAIGNILTKNAVTKVMKLKDGPPVPQAKQTSIIPDSPLKAANAKTPEKKVSSSKPAVKVPASKVKKSAVKAKGAKPSKKAKPPREEKAVTVEWEIGKKSDQIKKDRNRIVNQLDKKNKLKGKNQMTMDI